MPSRFCVVAPCAAAALAFLVASGPASAAPAPVSGVLSLPGYTVIALAPNGQASTAMAQGGSFSLVPPAEQVSLHLRAADGTYAGPVVLEEAADRVGEARAVVKKAKRRLRRAKRKVRSARKRLRKAGGTQAERKATKRLKKAGKRRRRATKRLSAAKRLLATTRQDEAARAGSAVVGVKAGARLGEIDVKPAAGYALADGLSQRVRRIGVGAEQKAQAVGGVPIGAGNFGFVAARPAAGVLPGDLDVDGVPDPLDIDDDGDLVLDNFERGTAARTVKAAQSGDGCPTPCTPDLTVAAELAVRLEESVNANAGALSRQDLDATLSAFGDLRIGFPHDSDTELDCGGLSYCSTGGTGSAVFGPPGESETTPFPACCDPDGDGFGTMNELAATDPFSGHANQFFLAHGATTDEIGTGDVLIERATPSGGVETELPITVQDVFATVPALISYHDGAANSATVSYPLPPPYTGSWPGPDEPREGFPVSAGPGGDVVLTFTFWRPQREAIADEPGEWTDIGGLFYHAVLIPGTCPPNTFSTTDSELAPANVGPGGGGFLDQTVDEPANPENTHTFSLNVTQCLMEYGLAWDPGQSVLISLVATNSGEDHAAQLLQFTRVEP